MRATTTTPGPAAARAGILLAVLLAALGAGACGAHRVTLTQRSAIEQQLLTRSIERAVARLDTTRLAGRPVALTLHALTTDQAFAERYVTAQLRARGIRVVSEASRAEVRLETYATALGVDRAETLLGIPALEAPVVSTPIPEIALFKWARNRSHTEVQAFLFEPGTDRFLDRLPVADGRAKSDEFTILIFVRFTVSDIDDPPPGEAPGPR